MITARHSKLPTSPWAVVVEGMHAVLTAAAVLGPRGAVHVAGLAVFVGVETSRDSTGWEYGL
jgi:hypothetical protein